MCFNNLRTYSRIGHITLLPIIYESRMLMWFKFQNIKRVLFISQTLCDTILDGVGVGYLQFSSTLIIRPFTLPHNLV